MTKKYFSREIGLSSKLIIALAIFLFTISLASASVLAYTLEITGPDTILEGETASLSLTVDSNYVFNGTVDLQYSGNMVSSTTSIVFTESMFTFVDGSYLFEHSWTADAGSPGPYFVYGELMNASGYTLSVHNHSGIVEEIDTAPPVIRSSYPYGLVITSSFVMNLTTDENAICKFGTSDAEYNSLSNTFSVTGADTHYESFTLANGAYVYYVRCKDDKNNIMSSSEVLSFIVQSADDTEPPVVLLSTPSGVLSNTVVTLTVKTDEVSICRYDTNDVSYEMMESTLAGTLDHDITITVIEGEHDYYVLCKDGIGNTMVDAELISFKVTSLPTASISLDKKSPLMAGTVAVTLSSSESLKTAPSLRYSYSNSPTSYKTVSLTGSGTNWDGFLILETNEGKKIGTFKFSGEDMYGNKGSEITKGGSFVVDTEKPAVVESLRVESERDGSIFLRWYYDGEEVDKFNVYRATSPSVGYVDKYTSTESSTYSDENAENKATYYYRVAAIDKAGNLGDLSDERYATALNVISPEDEQGSGSEGDLQDDELQDESNEAETDTPKVLPPNLIPKVDALRKTLDSQLIDLGSIISDLKSERDERKRTAISDLGILETLDATEGKLTKLRDELTALKSIFHTDLELDAKLKTIESKMVLLKEEMPVDVSVIEDTRFIQSISPVDVERAVDLVLTDLAVTDDEKEFFIEKNKNIQLEINVETKAKVLRIEYGDRSEVERTYIKKRVSYLGVGDLSDVVVLEIIPKTVSERAGDINFETPGYNIVEEDPVVKWGFYNFKQDGEEIVYSVDYKVDIEEIKKTKSITLLSINQLEQIYGVPITGNTILESFGDATGLNRGGSIILFIGIIIIFGLMGYYFFISVKGEAGDVERGGRAVDSTSGTIGRIEQNFLSQLNPRVKEINRALEEKGTGRIGPGMERQVIPNDQISSELSRINYLIELAKLHISSNQMKEAVKLYPLIEETYRKLPKELQKHVFEDCNKLHLLIQSLN